MTPLPKIGITMGDPSGIGPEPLFPELIPDDRARPAEFEVIWAEHAADRGLRVHQAEEPGAHFCRQDFGPMRRVASGDTPVEPISVGSLETPGMKIPVGNLQRRHAISLPHERAGLRQDGKLGVTRTKRSLKASPRSLESSAKRSDNRNEQHPARETRLRTAQHGMQSGEQVFILQPQAETIGDCTRAVNCQGEPLPY